MLSIPFDKLFKGDPDVNILEDFIDKWHFTFSVRVLVVFAMLTCAKQHFGDPIACMPSAESPNSWVAYYHQLCYISDKFALSRAMEHKEETYPIYSYYQWVPYLLLLQAFIFYLPKAFWTSSSELIGSGMDVESTAKALVEIGKKEGEERTKALATGSSSFMQFLRHPLMNGRHWTYGRVELMLYVTMKWACVLVVLGQLHGLAWFVAGGDHNWPFQVYDDIVYRRSSKYFPLVTLCIIDKLELGDNNQQQYMQCVLMYNYINEKIALILFVWLSILLCFSILSALFYSSLLLIPHMRANILKDAMKDEDVSNLINSGICGRSRLSNFTHFTLRTDGIFLIMAVRRRAGAMLASDVLSAILTLDRSTAPEPGWKYDGYDRKYDNGKEYKRVAAGRGRDDQSKPSSPHYYPRTPPVKPKAHQSPSLDTVTESNENEQNQRNANEKSASECSFGVDSLYGSTSPLMSPDGTFRRKNGDGENKVKEGKGSIPNGREDTSLNFFDESTMRVTDV